MQPIQLPPPLCAKCGKPVDELRVEPAPPDGRDLLATATCHGETETTELPNGLLHALHFGHARLLQGEAFRVPS